MCLTMTRPVSGLGRGGRHVHGDVVRVAARCRGADRLRAAGAVVSQGQAGRQVAALVVPADPAGMRVIRSPGVRRGAVPAADVREHPGQLRPGVRPAGGLRGERHLGRGQRLRYAVRARRVTGEPVVTGLVHFQGVERGPLGRGPGEHLPGQRPVRARVPADGAGPGDAAGGCGGGDGGFRERDGQLRQGGHQRRGDRGVAGGACLDGDAAAGVPDVGAALVDGGHGGVSVPFRRRRLDDPLVVRQGVQPGPVVAGPAGPGDLPAGRFAAGDLAGVRVRRARHGDADVDGAAVDPAERLVDAFDRTASPRSSACRRDRGPSRTRTQRHG